MARPAFTVQYLVFCTSLEYIDPTRPNRDSILHGVDYTFKVPPNTEFPFEPDEFWLFARFYSQSDFPGDSRPVTISCIWLDPPGGQEFEVWRRDLGSVRFFLPWEVVDHAWAFRNIGNSSRFDFPGIGRYEFRLWHSTRKWPGERVQSREFIRVEVVP